jgi:hypothetical protein
MEEERAAFDRLTHQAKLPSGRKAPDAEQTPTVQNQELVSTALTSHGAGHAGPDDVTRADREQPQMRTIELESPPGGSLAPAAAQSTDEKSKRPVWIAIAAVAALLIAVSGYFLTRRVGTEPVPASTVATSTAATAVGGTVSVVAPGRIGLQAFPWGEVTAVKNIATGVDVQVAEKLVTPGSIELPAGRYEITVSNPSYPKPQTQSVEIASGETKVVSFLFRKATEADYPDFGGRL